MEQHPLSAAFPAMSTADLSALTDDIATHGLRQPIVLFEGDIIDGWHRYQACVASGIKPRFVDLEADDPVAFVLSANLSRRHLSASQRAAAVVACSEWKPVGNRALESNQATLPNSTDDEMAARADVSRRTIIDAKAAHRAGRGADVRDGKVSASAAAGRAPRKPAKGPAFSEYNHGEEQELSEPSERLEAIDDLALELEAAVRIINADDKTAAAWDECKALSAKMADLNRLYDAKCVELATMTREAKRWKRKAEQYEKGELK